MYQSGHGWYASLLAPLSLHCLLACISWQSPPPAMHPNRASPSQGSLSCYSGTMVPTRPSTSTPSPFQSPWHVLMPRPWSKGLGSPRTSIWAYSRYSPPCKGHGQPCRTLPPSPSSNTKPCIEGLGFGKYKLGFPHHLAMYLHGNSASVHLHPLDLLDDLAGSPQSPFDSGLGRVLQG